MARIETITYYSSVHWNVVKCCNGLSKYLERYILESLTSSVWIKQEITKYIVTERIASHGQ